MQVEADMTVQSADKAENVDEDQRNGSISKVDERLWLKRIYLCLLSDDKFSLEVQ